MGNAKGRPNRNIGLAHNPTPSDPDDWWCEFCEDYHPTGELPCREEQQAFSEGPREYAHWCLDKLFETADEDIKRRINVMIDRLEECPDKE